MQICCFFARGGEPFGTQLPDKFDFKKSYLMISHGYVKDIL